ncbi:MAG: nucleoside-diphosphate-sugar epimerase [Psychromonas sp.]|jgi:nucleoside-diphosphate-sugar epimerase|uniref:2-alkyl-3-oxoalkanoate reductase n=1 Tax=Psychromonas sp. TaxID=1884585 RepID=UPI0039E56E7B
MPTTQTTPLSQLDEKQQAILKQLANQVKRVFVTGAGGFLGKALCRSLRAANIEVVGFARSDYPELKQMGVVLIKGDIADQHALSDAMLGCDLVFHVASKAGVWGSKESYFQPNVSGTENIIQICQALNIPRLVYTSTPSVTFCGLDENGIDETQPYAQQFLNFYGLSKAIAEKRVLDANCAALKTVALRPHLIWGPGDPHLVPRVLQRAEAGKLKLVGKTDKLVDTIYIDNAVYAHLLAAVKLNESQPVCAGKAYFLSNDQPLLMAEMLNKILACKGLPPVTKRLPAALAYNVGMILEWIYLGLRKKEEPMMTRFVARQLSTSHYFNISAAKRDLDYQPLVSIEQGMLKLQASLQ